MEKPLNHSELYTLADKDEQYYRVWLGDDIQEIAQRCLGVKKWMQFRSAITILSRFGYFATNSLFDAPTPGEEFCNAQMRSNSLAQRLLMILLNNDLDLPKEVPKPIINLLKDVHLITFYLFGDFYEISKRVTGVNYISCDPDNHVAATTSLNIINKLIGCLSLIKLIFSIPQQQEQMKLSSREDEEPTLSESKTKTTALGDVSMICQLCSSVREEPTSTLCGHIFCWTCIHNWLKERNECPICRMPTEPSRLIHLINFR